MVDRDSEVVDETKLRTTLRRNSGATRITPFDLMHRWTTSGATTPWVKVGETHQDFVDALVCGNGFSAATATEA